jgi:hypothetical protein
MFVQFDSCVDLLYFITDTNCIIMSFQSKSGTNVTQWDLELLYGRIIQWAFLTSKAKKCSRDQEKQATVGEMTL